MRPVWHFISPIDYIHGGEKEKQADRLKALGTPTAPFPTGTGGRIPGWGQTSAVPKSLLPQRGQNTDTFLLCPLWILVQTGSSQTGALLGVT